MVIVLVNIQTNPVLFFYTGILGIATLIFKQTNLGVTSYFKLEAHEQ